MLYFYKFCPIFCRKGEFLAFWEQVNWIDVLVLIILIRTTYIAVRTGFPSEVFKLGGTICAIWLACHYYTRLGDFIRSYFSLQGQVWVNLLDALAVFALAFLGYAIFVGIRLVFTILIKIEAVSLLNRWGAFILGLLRWSLVTSLLFFLIAVSVAGYLRSSLYSSFSGPRLIKLTPGVYLYFWDKLMNRFMDEQAFNREAVELSEDTGQ